MMTNSLILPKHILDTKREQKKKKESEKIPQPTGFRIVILPLTLKSKTKSGLHLTDKTIEEAQITTNICKVLKVGPDAYKDKERFPKKPWCKEGDWVIIAKYAGSRISIEGGELRIINDDEILATIDHPRDILPKTFI